MQWRVRRHIDPGQPAGEREGLRLMNYATTLRISALVSRVFGIGGCGTMICKALGRVGTACNGGERGNIGIRGARQAPVCALHRPNPLRNKLA